MREWPNAYLGKRIQCMSDYSRIRSNAAIITGNMKEVTHD